MPNVIKPKRSAVAGNIPTTSQIAQYEIAMNTADKKIFTSNGTNIIQIAAGELSGLGDVQLTSLSNGQSLSYNSTTGKWVNSNVGAGDVVGPSSSTDNSVVRFDGTTGKVIQGSPVAISDTGAISGAESISNIDFAQFDTTVTVTEGVGKLQWDDGNGTLQFGLKGGNVNLQLGQEIVARVYNDSGVALTDGQIVYISGSQGNRIAVKLAKADSEATSAGTLGMVTESIAVGAEGFITMVGTVNKLNTSGLTAGALVYLSATTAGAYTTTPPTAPNHRVTLGYVERVDSVVGSIYVKVDNGYELDELHNVVITGPTSGQTLIYDAVAGTWENAALTAGTGISVTNGAGTITIANTGVTSIAGTANQITASASTGGVTLSLPATINVNTSGSAATLTTGRTIGMTGDVTWTSGSFDGSANVTGTATLASVGAAGTYTKVTTDAKGRVTSGTTLSASDIPDITLEKVPDAWVKRSVKAATTANITLSGTQTIDGVALVAGDRVLVKDQTTASQNGIYVVSATAWSRSADADTISELAGACVNVDSGTTNGGMRFDTDLKTTDTLGTTAVSFYRVLDSLDLATANTANKVVLRDGSGNFSAGTITAALSGNASTATTLQTARTINGTSFNGSANITTNSWGTARTLTIGSTGKSVDGSAAVSWTLAEIGAQPVDADLTAIAGLAGTSGFLKKTAADTWSLDTNTYYLASNPDGYTTNTGTVTSVSATAGTGISITGSPITTSGTLTITNTAPNVTTDISITHNASTVVVNSSDGTDGTINAATTTLAGVMSSADKTKLDGIATGANNYTLPAATSTALGGIELFSDTVQTVAANAVTATASRTYGIQINSSGQAVVNVPWTDTNSGGTVTSVSGTGTVSGLTLTGTVTGSGSLTLGGTLSLTSAQVTTALGYTPYNSTNPNGYITSSGSITGSSGSVSATVTGTNATNLVYGNMADNDQARIRIGGDASNAGWLEIATADDGTEPIYVRQYTGVFTTVTRTLTLLDGSGNTSIPGSFTASSNITAYSDESLKKNWDDLPSDFIEKLALVKRGTYTRIDTGDRQAGSSAQDWQKLLPEVVKEDDNGILSLAYGNAALVSVIELADKVIKQEERIKQLESLVNQLMQKLA